MSKSKVDPASRPDADNPEWTRDDFRTARPALEVVSEVFGEAAAASLARQGRAAEPQDEVGHTLRLDADVFEAYRQEGEGWEGRMNEVLRQHMPHWK